MTSIHESRHSVTKSSTMKNKDGNSFNFEIPITKTGTYFNDSMFDDSRDNFQSSFRNKKSVNHWDSEDIDFDDEDLHNRFLQRRQSRDGRKQKLNDMFDNWGKDCKASSYMDKFMERGGEIDGNNKDDFFNDWGNAENRRTNHQTMHSSVNTEDVFGDCGMNNGNRKNSTQNTHTVHQSVQRNESSSVNPSNSNDDQSSSKSWSTFKTERNCDSKNDNKGFGFNDDDYERMYKTPLTKETAFTKEMNEDKYKWNSGKDKEYKNINDNYCEKDNSISSDFDSTFRKERAPSREFVSNHNLTKTNTVDDSWDKFNSDTSKQFDEINRPWGDGQQQNKSSTHSANTFSGNNEASSSGHHRSAADILRDIRDKYDDNTDDIKSETSRKSKLRWSDEDGSLSDSFNIYTDNKKVNHDDYDKLETARSEEDSCHKLFVDVHDYTDGEVKVRALSDCELIVECCADKVEGQKIKRLSYKKPFKFDDPIDVGKVTSVISSEGILAIKAPKLRSDSVPLRSCLKNHDLY